MKRGLDREGARASARVGVQSERLLWKRVPPQNKPRRAARNVESKRRVSCNFTTYFTYIKHRDDDDDDASAKQTNEMK